jgi:hypothetical protein
VIDYAQLASLQKADFSRHFVHAPFEAAAMDGASGLRRTGYGAFPLCAFRDKFYAI